MKNDFIKIEISVLEPWQAELIAYRLAEQGYNGMEELENKVIGYIESQHFDSGELDLILSEYGLTYSKSNIGNINWNEEWERNFAPVFIGNFVGIRASFHEPLQGFEHEVVITPKMSFGTGHHATTYMMIQLMKGLDFKGKNVFDFGTGTGVLAIVAEKLGAKRVLATDNDTWCFENASENITYNHSKIIDIQLNDSANINEKFDIVLANINKHILLENNHHFSQIVDNESFLLMSGLLQEDEEEMRLATSAVGFEHKLTLYRDKWIAMLWQKVKE